MSNEFFWECFLMNWSAKELSHIFLLVTPYIIYLFCHFLLLVSHLWIQGTNYSVICPFYFTGNRQAGSPLHPCRFSSSYLRGLMKEKTCYWPCWFHQYPHPLYSNSVPPLWWIWQCSCKEEEGLLPLAPLSDRQTYLGHVDFCACGHGHGRKLTRWISSDGDRGSVNTDGGLTLLSLPCVR